jgi:hypothetical protein
MARCVVERLGEVDDGRGGGNLADCKIIKSGSDQQVQVGRHERPKQPRAIFRVCGVTRRFVRVPHQGDHSRCENLAVALVLTSGRE